MSNEGLSVAAAAIQIFHLLPYACARSVLSKQAGDDEQGAVFAMTHSTQAIVGFLGPLFHNFVFTYSVRVMNGLVFLLSAPLLAIPILLLL